MGGSIQRSIYQGLTQPLPGNIFPKYTVPKTKSEDPCPKDKLLDGEMRGKYKKGQATEKPDNITQTSISYSLYD